MIYSDIHIKFKTLFLIVIVNFILQSTILQNLKINGISANYTLILVVLITIIYGLESGLFTAIFAGLFVDVYLSMAIGLNLFILVIISLLISIIGRPLFIGNKFTLIFMMGISTILYQFMYYFFMYFLNKGIKISEIMIHVIPVEIVFNSFVCVIGYLIAMKWIERYKLE